MRNRSVRILHDGQEYYLVDRGASQRSRVITMLKRVEGEVPAALERVKTDVGDCVAVANWKNARLELEPGCEELRDAFERIVERYLVEFRLGRARKVSRPYFFLSVDQQPLFELARAQPFGLSLLVFSEKRDAKKAALDRRGIEAREIEVEELADLPDFLTSRASEGYAGATLDGSDPIYFCADAAGAPRFLRLSLDESTGELEHFLLEEDGKWTRYEGAEELTPELDQDACDQQMVERLGELPFVGYHDHLAFWRPRRRSQAGNGELVVVDSGDNARVDRGCCPIFHDRDLAAGFLHDHLLEDCELIEVDDLHALAQRAGAEGKVLVIQPDGHRAHGGSLWVKDDRLVLDSFSGIWTSQDRGRTFERLAPIPNDEA